MGMPIKNWKVVKTKFSKSYYISQYDLGLDIIKSNLTRKEALNFWKILNKLRR